MILDTTVVFDMIVPGPATKDAVSLIDQDEPLFAPDHLRCELAGALTRAVRRGDVKADFARTALSDAEAILPILEPTAPLIDAAFALSLELHHPLYDCLFLAHAERRATRLVTSDQRFIDKLQGTSHARHITHTSRWRD